jgi:predicted nucleic acid-binding protein
MGLILDSSVLIAAERKGKTTRQTLTEIAAHAPGEEVALSVVTVIELMHGVVRAGSPQRKSVRQQFLNELIVALPVYPVTIPVALRAGQIDWREHCERYLSGSCRPVDRDHGTGAWISRRH